MKTIEELRQTIDLLALAERDTSLKRTGGGWYAGPCPFCGGKDRFVLKRTNDGWRWLCRHCTDGKYLDAIDYLQRRDNLSFAEAVKTLGGGLAPSPLRRPPVQPEPQQDAAAIERLTQTAFQASTTIDGDSPLAERVRAYLYRRGFLPPTLERALLGAAEVYDPKAGRKRPAVSIPYFNPKLDARAVKYRFADDDPNGLRYVMEKGSAAGFYYLPETLGHFDRLLVVEGELNLLSLAQVVPELDLISTGSQSLSEGMKRALSKLAGRYRKAWVWMDEPQKAAETARLLRGTPLQTPRADGQKWDANRLLQEDMLHDFIERLTGVRCYGWTLKGWAETEGANG